MKKTTSFTILCFFISFGSFAQKERFIYRPRFIQASIRAGLVNGSLNLEYRLNPKTIASVDLGVGIVHLHSNYYNKFNVRLSLNFLLAQELALACGSTTNNFNTNFKEVTQGTLKALLSTVIILVQS